MSAADWGPCGACGSDRILLHVEDGKLGEAGPITLTCEDCHVDLQLPAEATARTRIAAIRAIVRDHSARRIEGYLVDAVTAALLVAVYDALSRSTGSGSGWCRSSAWSSSAGGSPGELAALGARRRRRLGRARAHRGRVGRRCHGRPPPLKNFPRNTCASGHLVYPGVYGKRTYPGTAQGV